MSKVKLGRFTVNDYVAEKPIGIRGNGDLIYPSDLLNRKVAPSFGLPLASEENKEKLALARLKVEPDFELGVLNKVGKYTKEEIIKHIEDRSSLGLQIVDIEVKYSEYFTNQLLGNIPIKEKIIPVKNVQEKRIPAEWRFLPKKHLSALKTKVLFCENTTDSVTSPAAAYRIANVHPVFAARGFNVISLEGVNDARIKFQQSSDSTVVYISGIGHGNYSTYTGDLQKVILQVGGYNASEVSKKVLHFLSCETGRTLGPDTVAKGAKGYVGYDENFVFDWANANLYWPCDSQFDISMANGRTIEQAINDTIAKYNAAIASVPGTTTAATLLSDRNLLRSPVSGPAWGTKTVTISPFLFHYLSLAEFLNR